MGINLGAALGAATKTGFDTYRGLEEEKRLQEEHAWKKKEQDDQEAISKALAANQPGQQTTGTGDMSKPELSSTNSQSMPVSDSDGMPLQTKNVSLKEAQNNAYKAMLDSGVSVQKAQQAIMGGYQLSNAEMENTKATNNQATLNRVMNIYSAADKYAQDKDLAGYVNTLGPEISQVTGNKIALVNNPNGTQEVHEINSDGKLIKNWGSDVNKIHAVVEPLVAKHAMTLYAAMNPDYALKEKTADAEVMKGKGALMTGEAHKIIAGKEKNSIKDKANETATALIEAKEINPITKKPYTPEEAKVAAYKMLLKAPSELKGDAQGNYTLGNKLYVPDPKNPGKYKEAEGIGANLTFNSIMDPANAPTPAASKSKVAVQSQGAKQMDLAAAKAGWKPLGIGGDMYFKQSPDGTPIHMSGAALAKELGLNY